MTNTRDIVLGGRTFAVPLLPLRYNRVIYPLCRDLSDDPDNGDTFVDRIIKSGGTPSVVRDDEWPKLGEIAFQAACAADSALTRAAFDDLPIPPQELIDAFFNVRYQTGVWLAPEAAGAGTGEAPKKEAESG